MRIIGGKYKGRSFHPGKSFKARPTTDFAKESLFNVLNNTYDFEAIKILDLFAGTGSISFEFFSRGAKDITMVELNYKHVSFIQSVLKDLDEKATIYRTDVFKAISKFSMQFDLVFADPPYDHPKFNEIADLVMNSDVVKPGGLFILEHPKAFNYSNRNDFKEMRKYGNVHFSFFAKPV